MNFFKTSGWEEIIALSFSVLFLLIVPTITIMDQGDTVLQSELSNATITLKSWEYEGTPGHRALIIVDANGNEYYVDGLFLRGAFRQTDWQYWTETGDILQVTFHEKKNGSNSIFALSKKGHVYMSVDEAMGVQVDNDRIIRYMGYSAITLAAVFLLLILGIAFVKYNEPAGSKALANAADTERSENICVDRAEDMIKASFRCTIRRICVSVGQSVKKGDILLEISALQMHFPIEAGMDGVVREVYVQPGDVVEKDMPIIKLVEA